MAAPLFYTTKNRAVTESDFNAILKSKFTEYQDMKAWGGNREYFNITDALTTKIDASSLVYDPATQKYSGTFDDIFTLVTDMLADLYRSGVMTIDNVDYESIVDGKYRPDSGYVYYSAFNKGFKFISSDSDKSEIVSFLDKYKILTIFFKFMDPTFIFIKPTITLSIKSAFQRSVNVQNIQELVKSWMNLYVGYNRKIDMKDLNGYLLQQEYIQSVDSISFTATTKIKVPDTITDKVYMRLFNRLKASPVNLPMYRYNSSGLKIEIGRFTVTSPNNKVKISITGGGIIYGDDNSYNPDKGCFVFTLPAAYAGYKEIFIEGFEFKRNILSAKREGVIAVENTSDVQIILG
jgi:hypothetical protein